MPRKRAGKRPGPPAGGRRVPPPGSRGRRVSRGRRYGGRAPVPGEVTVSPARWDARWARSRVPVPGRAAPEGRPPSSSRPVPRRAAGRSAPAPVSGAVAGPPVRPGRGRRLPLRDDRVGHRSDVLHRRGHHVPGAQRSGPAPPVPTPRLRRAAAVAAGARAEHVARPARPGRGRAPPRRNGGARPGPGRGAPGRLPAARPGSRPGARPAPRAGGQRTSGGVSRTVRSREATRSNCGPVRGSSCRKKYAAAARLPA